LRRSFFTEICCATEIILDVEDGVVVRCEFVGGCPGNTQGVSRLVAGMRVSEAAKRLEGIDCEGKGSSCPDQLSKCLRKIEEELKGHRRTREGNS
jgi:uncharacterized protein (TIGR03905 family)